MSKIVVVREVTNHVCDYYIKTAATLNGWGPLYVHVQYDLY